MRPLPMMHCSSLYRTPLDMGLHCTASLLLMTFGGQHRRPVQTCSLDGLYCTTPPPNLHWLLKHVRLASGQYACFLVIDSFNAAHAGSEICKFVQGNLHKLGRTIDQPQFVGLTRNVGHQGCLTQHEITENYESRTTLLRSHLITTHVYFKKYTLNIAFCHLDQKSTIFRSEFQRVTA